MSWYGRLVPKGRNLDYEKVQAARKRGKTYAELAVLFQASESAVYYACNPGVRRHRRSAVGTPRSIYASDHTWEQLRARAAERGLSISAVLDLILYHEDPEPLVRPFVEVEETAA